MGPTLQPSLAQSVGDMSTVQGISLSPFGSSAVLHVTRAPSEIVAFATQAGLEAVARRWAPIMAQANQRMLSIGVDDQGCAFCNVMSSSGQSVILPLNFKRVRDPRRSYLGQGGPLGFCCCFVHYGMAVGGVGLSQRTALWVPVWGVLGSDIPFNHFERCTSACDHEERRGPEVSAPERVEHLWKPFIPGRCPFQTSGDVAEGQPLLGCGPPPYHLVI